MADSFDELLSAYLHGRPSDDDGQALRSRILADPRALDEFLRAVDAHAELRRIFSEAQGKRAAFEERKPAESGPQGTGGLRPSTRRKMARSSRIGRNESRFSYRSLAVAAEGVLLGLVALVTLWPSGSGSGRRGDPGQRPAPEARVASRQEVEEGIPSEAARRAEERAQQAEARLQEIERQRKALSRSDSQSGMDPVLEAKRKKDLEKLDSDKQRIEREMREAIDLALFSRSSGSVAGR